MPTISPPRTASVLVGILMQYIELYELFYKTDSRLKLVQVLRDLEFQRHSRIVCKGVKQSLAQIRFLQGRSDGQAEHLPAGRAGLGWYQSRWG
jgi:hypothetical protein